jgi:hypothetical protein
MPMREKIHELENELKKNREELNNQKKEIEKKDSLKEFCFMD